MSTENDELYRPWTLQRRGLRTEKYTVEQSQKPDADVKREMQLAAKKYDLSTAKPLKEIVLGEIKQGVRPEWVAIKYGHLGVTLDRVLAAKAAIDRQTEARRERENAARNGFEAPQGQRSADAE